MFIFLNEVDFWNTSGNDTIWFCFSLGMLPSLAQCKVLFFGNVGSRIPISVLAYQLKYILSTSRYIYIVLLCRFLFDSESGEDAS